MTLATLFWILVIAIGGIGVIGKLVRKESFIPENESTFNRMFMFSYFAIPFLLFSIASKYHYFENIAENEREEYSIPCMKNSMQLSYRRQNKEVWRNNVSLKTDSIQHYKKEIRIDVKGIFKETDYFINLHEDKTLIMETVLPGFLRKHKTKHRIVDGIVLNKRYSENVMELDSVQVDSVLLFWDLVPLLSSSRNKMKRGADYKFNSPQVQADSLLYFMKKATISNTINRVEWEQKFFKAFPNSYREMLDLFGCEDGPAPLYAIDNKEMKYRHKGIPSNVIGYFSELESIPAEIYYKKYIDINIDGCWQADNIHNAFGLHYRLLNDFEHISPVLSKYADNEIKSVFRFIWDGPHPKNKTNEKIYKQLKTEIEGKNKQIGQLLTQAYEKLMTEEVVH